jgi:hypothetical protein
VCQRVCTEIHECGVNIREIIVKVIVSSEVIIIILDQNFGM